MECQANERRRKITTRNDMKVVVGSTNPVKINAVSDAFKQYYPEYEIVGQKVSSGIAEQPLGEEETLRGATNRALAAKQYGEFGVGLEGGVAKVGDVMFVCAWCVIVDSKGNKGMGGGLYFELPKKASDRIIAGGELGPIMNELTGEENVKEKSGAIGIFTKGRLDRKTAYTQLVTSALIKFVSPEWFV